MNVNTKQLTGFIEAEIAKHRGMRGQSGKGIEWEEGFIAGLEHVAKFMIPAVENDERQECDAVAESIVDEYETRDARRIFFGTDETQTP